MSEFMLLAIEGGSTVRKGKDVPCGMMAEGFCVALAATPGLNEPLEFIGSDSVARMLEENDVNAPPTGGLWVLTTQPDPRIRDDEDKECGFSFRWLDWRKPTAEELTGLLARQDYRQRRAKNPDAEPACDQATQETWTFRWARV